MKGNKGSILLLLLAAVLLICGYSQGYLQSLAKELTGFEGSFQTMKANVEDIADAQIRYHDLLVDLNSIKENALGTRVVIKPDTTIVKADSGSLIYPSGRQKRKDIEEVVSKIEELYSFVSESGIPFLYCAAPTKLMYETAPPNIQNRASENMDAFITLLRESEIPYIDFRETFAEESIDKEDIFFYTDHHWTVRSGWIASRAICEELNNKYGFSYDPGTADIRNYEISTLEDWFLGSYGKKVGRFFSSPGVDDFQLIVPRFATDMTEEQPFENEERHGSFEDTVIYKENLEKDLYRKNTYEAYCGGDSHLQILKNNMIRDGKKILLLRDSFGCAVAPFLSLHTRELDICDMREAAFVSGERIDLRDFITKTKPDYVIVLYAGVGSTAIAGKYDFLE